MRRLFIILLAGQATIYSAPTQGEPERIYEKMHKLELGPAGRKKVTEEEFDLRRADITDFVLQRMNRVEKRGDEGIGDVMEIDPARAFEWMLDNYHKLGPTGRGKLISNLGGVGQDYREFYPLLTMMLDDQALDVNPRAEIIWPGPRRLLHLRVCDRAYNRLTLRIGRDSGPLPPDLPRVLLEDDPFEYRDNAILKFKTWWKDAMDGIASKRPSLATNRPEIEQKLNQLLRKEKGK